MLKELIQLIIVIPFVFFLPGFFLILPIFGWKGNNLSFFERAAMIVPVSVISVDLIVLFLNRLGVLVNGPVLVGAVMIFCSLGYAFFQLRKKGTEDKNYDVSREEEKIFDFSTRQVMFVVLAITLAIFIRTTYLLDTIVPSATDLGHHMYWSQLISDTGKLPAYGIPDFIIGEHIIFSVVNLLSGASLISAMPVLVLLLFNVVGIFTLAVLAGRIFKDTRITAAAIFIIGVLYAVSPPQTRYVSGGVVGNVIGDMLIPLCLYFLYRALSEKNSKMAAMFLFSLAGLLYTHHHSSLVLIYVLAGIAITYLILNFDRISQVFMEWLRIFSKPFPAAVLAVIILFFLVVYTPTYFNASALNKATGEPVKITRLGLDIGKIEENVGGARMFMGVIGFLLLLYLGSRRRLSYSFALSWCAMMFLMSWKPGWLYLNIPSDRIGNYLFLPFSLLASYGLVTFFDLIKKSSSKFFATSLLFILMFFVATNGLADSAESFKIKPQFEETAQTFHSARYLAGGIDSSRDVVLKDHVNIYADSWYKLFFMKDYKYPLSRGNLSRYVDPTNPRETCTRDMISEPQSEKAKTCYSETRVNYVALNARLEGNSFEKYHEFSKIYSSNYISIFKRN